MSTDTSTTTTAAEPDSTVAVDTATTDTETADTADATAQGSLEDGSEVDEDQDDDAGKGGREAAKYRRRLRDTEAERDRLAGQVEAMQRAEVDRLAEAAGLKPAAVWASGTELAGLLDGNGTVDAGKVSEAIAGARESLGIPKPAHNTKEGRTVGRPAGKPSGRDAMVGVVMGRGVAGDD